MDLMGDLIGTRMVSDGKTARQLFEEVMANPARKKFGFGEKLAIVNVDFQQAYTRTDMFATAYETDPRQIDYVNTLSRLARTKAMPVVWSRVGYMDNGDDAGVWDLGFMDVSLRDFWFRYLVFNLKNDVWGHRPSRRRRPLIREKPK